ncbi:hypothetical protein [Arthrobacter sp. SLBN-83]|nr:hypothetical protein [Arthrobacter sp. SLBN-83]
MTNPTPSTAAHATSCTRLDDLDLTPDVLADAPAHEEDQESLVHIGNS